MRQYNVRGNFKRALLHPLISGSILVSAGSLFANVINFVFNVFLSRNLSVQDYGVVASLTAIITLFGISAGAIIPTVVNFTAESFLNNNLTYIRSVYFKIAKPFYFIGALVLLIFVVFSGTIASFLNIESSPILIILTGVIIFIGFATILNHAVFQARLSFHLFSFLNILASTIKLIFGMILIFLGFKAPGAMLAILISYIASFFLGFYFLKFLFVSKISDVEIDIGEIFRYAAPSGLALLAFTSISSTDLILVKHLFDPDSSGVYAGLSLIGRVIMFFTAPIGIVMFPIMSRKHKNNEKYGNIFFLSLLLVMISSLSITAFYFLFPEFVIRLFLKNEAYLSVAPILGYFGVFASLYSICSIMMYFFLSINKTWVYKPILAAAILQAVGIYIFHNSFAQVIFVSTGVVILLLSFLSYYSVVLNRRN